jgi:hypothetical protein
MRLGKDVFTEESKANFQGHMTQGGYSDFVPSFTANTGHEFSSRDKNRSKMMNWYQKVHRD